MNKITLLILTMLVLVFASCSKDDTPTKTKLSKKIVTTVKEKTDTTKTTTFVTNFSYGENGFFNNMNFEITFGQITFDQNGKEVKTSFTVTQDFTVDKFNSSNHILKDIHTYKNKTGNDVMDIGEHTYDKNGFLTKSVVTYHHGLVTLIDYEYNSEGLKIKEISTEKDDEYYEYDARGTLVKNTKGPVVITYTYDGKENPMYSIAHKSYSHIWPKLMSKENLLTEVITSANGVKSVINYKNSYDLDGRIIKKSKNKTNQGSYTHTETTEYFYE